jgi:hypothetical protein
MIVNSKSQRIRDEIPLYTIVTVGHRNDRVEQDRYDKIHRAYIADLPGGYKPRRVLTYGDYPMIHWNIECFLKGRLPQNASALMGMLAMGPGLRGHPLIIGKTSPIYMDPRSIQTWSL